MTCPNCGYCPNCGRSGYPYNRPYIQPWYPYRPVPWWGSKIVYRQDANAKAAIKALAGRNR